MSCSREENLERVVKRHRLRRESWVLLTISVFSLNSFQTVQTVLQFNSVMTFSEELMSCRELFSHNFIFIAILNCTLNPNSGPNLQRTGGFLRDSRRTTSI